MKWASAAFQVAEGPADELGREAVQAFCKFDEEAVRIVTADEVGLPARLKQFFAYVLAGGLVVVSHPEQAVVEASHGREMIEYRITLAAVADNNPGSARAGVFEHTAEPLGMVGALRFRVHIRSSAEVVASSP